MPAGSQPTFLRPNLTPVPTMIRADSGPENYLTFVTNGEFTLPSDTTADKGGGNRGFRPHELLEAALASCMAMSLRMAAQQAGIPLGEVSVNVSLNRNGPSGPTFDYSVAFPATVAPADRATLLAALDSCPVRRTLSRPLHFNPHPTHQR